MTFKDKIKTLEYAFNAKVDHNPKSNLKGFALKNETNLINLVKISKPKKKLL